MLMNANVALTQFSIEQRKWLIARLLLPSDAAAARAIGVHPVTVCKWPEKDDLDKALKALLEDPKAQALAILLDAAPEAAKVKTEGLRSRKEETRQSVADDILDRVLGKALQKVAPTDPTGEREYSGFSDDERIKRIEALLRLKEGAEAEG